MYCRVALRKRRSLWRSTSTQTHLNITVVFRVYLVGVELSCPVGGRRPSPDLRAKPSAPPCQWAGRDDGGDWDRSAAVRGGTYGYSCFSCNSLQFLLYFLLQSGSAGLSLRFDSTRPPERLSYQNASGSAVESHRTLMASLLLSSRPSTRQIFLSPPF